MPLPHRVADGEGLIIGEIKTIFMQDVIDALSAFLDLPVGRGRDPQTHVLWFTWISFRSGPPASHILQNVIFALLHPSQSLQDQYPVTSTAIDQSKI